MASVQFSDVQARPTELLDLTSLTLDEFQQLVPPFEAAYQAHLAAWRLDGKPRTARRLVVSLDSVYGSKRSFDAHLADGGVQRGIPQRVSTMCKGTFSARYGRA